MDNLTYMEEVANNIAFAVASEPLNSRELEARLGVPYPTIRRAITSLLEDGRIMPFDRRARNTRYVPGNSIESKRAKVPSLMFKGQEIKMTNMYLNRGIEHIATSSADRILKAWTTIATTARRLNEGSPAPSLMAKLNREKIELVTARQNLEQMVFLINQMLSNTKLWDADNLTNFPDDPDWDEFIPHLEELYDNFYKEQ